MTSGTAAEWSATKLRASEIATERAGIAVAKLGIVPKDHPWFGTNILSQSPFDLERLNTKLQAASEKFRNLSTQLTKIFSHIVDNGKPSLSDAIATVVAFRHVAGVPENGRDILGNIVWAKEIVKIEEGIARGEKLTNDVREIEAQFNDEAWGFDTSSLLLTLRGDGSSFFRRFNSRYRQANADLHGICRGKPPKSVQQRIELVEGLRNVQEGYKIFANSAPLLSAALGPIWAELNTPWSDARAFAAWVAGAPTATKSSSTWVTTPLKEN